LADKQSKKAVRLAIVPTHVEINHEGL